MTFKRIILLFAICVLASCTGPKDKKGTQSPLQLVEMPMDSICTLKSNLEFFGEIQSMDFIDSTSFIIATRDPADVIRFEMNGMQVNKIGHFGKGPFEYISPSIVKVSDGKVYVWCNQSLKLIVYEPNGNSIKEYANFKKGIKAFDVCNNTVVFYLSGGFKESIIEIFDLDKNEIVYRSGEPSEEHLLLNLLEQAGGMTISDSLIYYVTPDNLSYNIINLNNRSSKKEKIFDDNFVVSKLNVDAISIINKNRNKAFDYLWNNCCVKDICVTDSIICLIAELGNYILDRNYFDYSERYCTFYFFDKYSGKSLYSYSVNKENVIGRFIDTSWGLFFLTEDKIRHDPKLYKIKI